MKASAPMRSGRNKIISAFLALVTALTALLLSACSQGDTLTVDILDIGKADCIVLRSQGKVCLIDTGEKEDRDDVQSFLSEIGIGQIDVLIISHFDKDHVGNAGFLVENYDVKSVYMSDFEKDNDPTRVFLIAMDQKGITPHRLTENKTVDLGGVKLTLSPPKASSYAEKEDNNASLTVLAQLGEKRLLFCGDAMELRIKEMLSEEIGDIDFMKVPYHGNDLENLPALLDITNPGYAAITCSNKNPPSDAVLSLLKERGIKTYLTENGAVRVTVTPSSLSVTQYN